MTKVYIVQHTRSDDDCDNIKFIGAYSSNTDAESAVNRLKNIQGFKDYSNGFSIDEYQVDKDHWVEGF